MGMSVDQLIAIEKGIGPWEIAQNGVVSHEARVGIPVMEQIARRLKGETRRRIISKIKHDLV